MYYISLALKRFFDIFLAILGMIFSLPIWIIVGIAIKLDSKGPILFKQKRRTKHGKIFNIYKFRTMVTNAEKMGTGLFNYKDDPRVTKVGNFLRKTSLDEIPQLLNILFGQMSFIGPRPCVENELGDFDSLNKKYKKRFEVKAGLSGLAQVKGRNDITWDNKVIFDNEYVDKFKKYGIFFDLKIMIETVIKVFKKENIYENKIDNSVDDETAAKLEEERIIKLAHQKD